MSTKKLFDYLQFPQFMIFTDLPTPFIKRIKIVEKKNLYTQLDRYHNPHLFIIKLFLTSFCYFSKNGL